MSILVGATLLVAQPRQGRVSMQGAHQGRPYVVSISRSQSAP
jgi:hypothetical protein